MPRRGTRRSHVAGPRARCEVVALSALLACSSSTTSSPRASIEDALAIDPYVDNDPDPHVVDVQMVAAVGQVEFLAGKVTEVWGYRDGARPGSQVSVPGPLLQAQQEDLVRVHFRNDLPWSTTVHWHGPRVPIAMDGSMSSQTSIVPGGTFDYEFVVRDAGTFWYHPHVLTDAEVSHGLYGPIVVRGGPSLEAQVDRVLVLSDAKLDPDGQWLPSETRDVIEGRRGGTLLVNGRVSPRVPALAGGRERWRLINASNARFYELALAGHGLTVVGWDGGLLPAPYPVTTLRIAPGERYELVVEVQGEVGSIVALSNVAPDLPGDVPTRAEVLDLELVGRAAAPPPLSATPWPTFVPPPVGELTTVRAISLSGPFERHGDIDFRLNDQRWPFTTPIKVRWGDTEVWQVQNTTERDEPFHIHGVFFAVLDRNGEKAPVQGWKDTAVVPAGGSLSLAVTYEERGMWMFHSHILEHAEHGMMSDLMVE